MTPRRTPVIERNAVPMRALLAGARRKQSGLLELVRRLVLAESPSDQKPAVDACTNLAAAHAKSLGVPTLDGMGAVGEGAHARHESALIEHLRRARHCLPECSWRRQLFSWEPRTGMARSGNRSTRRVARLEIPGPRPDTLPSESKQESFGPMKFFAFVLLIGSGAVLAGAQTKPAVHSATATQAAKSATTAHSTLYNLPPGIPRVHGVIRPMFTLHYEDYKIGTGPVAETNKLYHVLYTGYLAATGEKFDSSDEHRAPVMKDGKPVMGPDGKPQLGEPQPLIFPQGFGRIIPGFDQGFAGMRIGGKRRIFIPWQLAYGTRDIPSRAGHPGIPAKSDLIFDVELVEVTDMPQRPMGMPQHPGPRPGVPGAPGTPAQPAKPGAPSAPPSGTAPSSPSTPPVASAPVKPAATAQQSYPSQQPAGSQQSAPASSTQQPQSK